MKRRVIALNVFKLVACAACKGGKRAQCPKCDGTGLERDAQSPGFFGLKGRTP